MVRVKEEEGEGKKKGKEDVEGRRGKEMEKGDEKGKKLVRWVHAIEQRNDGKRRCEASLSWFRLQPKRLSFRRDRSDKKRKREREKKRDKKREKKRKRDKERDG